MHKDKLNLAVIVACFEGENLVRNFAAVERCNLKYVCDLDENSLKVPKRNFPFIQPVTDIESIPNDKDVGAIVITAPVPSHFELTRKALQARKHTYVEKPITLKFS